MGVEDIFKQSAERTRKLLGMKKQAMKSAQRQHKKPAFVKGGGARTQEPQLSGVQKEINDLLSDGF